MPVGGRQIKVTQIVVRPGVEVIFEYRHRILGSEPDESDFKGDTVTVRWADFVALTTAPQRSSLTGIATRLIAHVKDVVPLLENAEEL